MALTLRRLSKISLLAGGALIVAALILGVMTATTGPASVSAQASPTARPATPAATATPARTATPAARTPTPSAPGALPANGDSMAFPAVIIALAGAAFIGLGLAARYTLGKSRA
jgi:disulfide bond formation protein DsbB